MTEKKDGDKKVKKTVAKKAAPTKAKKVVKKGNKREATIFGAIAFVATVAAGYYVYVQLTMPWYTKALNAIKFW